MRWTVPFEVNYLEVARRTMKSANRGEVNIPTDRTGESLLLKHPD
jgi:hypothetical protein